MFVGPVSKESSSYKKRYFSLPATHFPVFRIGEIIVIGRKRKLQVKKKQTRPVAKSSSLASLVHHALCGGLIYSSPPLPCFSTLTSSRPYVGGERASRPTVAQVARTECEDKGGRKEERKFLTRVGRWARPPHNSLFFFGALVPKRLYVAYSGVDPVASKLGSLCGARKKRLGHHRRSSS